MATYRVRKDGEIAGVWRSAGEEIELTAEQAKYLAYPHGRSIELVVVREDSGSLVMNLQNNGPPALMVRRGTKARKAR